MSLDDLVKELQDYLSVLNIKKLSELDGDAVSRLAVKLASLNSTLGHYVAEAERDASLAEFAYDLERERLYSEARKVGKTIADSDNIKRTGAQEHRQKHITLQYNHRVLAYLRRDVGSLIDTLRSRLAYLRQDQDQS